MRFKIRSTQIELSYTLICFAAIGIIITSFEGFLFCLLSIIIHEAGHLTAMCILGFPPERIKLSIFEISISDNGRYCRRFFDNFLIILCGPLFNFICFTLLYLLYLLHYDVLFPFAAVNLSVGLFNMLPVMSLDGGQLLYLILSRRLSEKSAEKVVNIITFIFIFPLAALGFLLLFKSKYNFSLLFVCVYLIFSLIFKKNRYF